MHVRARRLIKIYRHSKNMEGEEMNPNTSVGAEESAQSGLRPKRRTAVATREKIHRWAEEGRGPEITKRKKRPSNPRCPYCSEAFKYSLNLWRHVATYHRNGQPLPQVDRRKPTKPAKSFHCSYCGKSFALKAILDVHIRTHTGERPYQCTTCNKRFTQQTALNYHVIMIHEPDQKPHKCLYCEKRFVSISLRNVHINSHTGYKPFKCKFCEKAFCAQSGLIVHTRTHTGELPYKCPYCDWRFGQCANLQAHAKLHHPFRSRPIPRECKVSEGREVATAFLHRRKIGRPTKASLRLETENSHSPQVTTPEEPGKLVEADVYPIAVELSDAFSQHSTTGTTTAHMTQRPQRSTTTAHVIQHPQHSATGIMTAHVTQRPQHSTTTAHVTQHPQHSAESTTAYMTQHPQHSATAPTTVHVIQHPQHSATGITTAPTTTHVTQHPQHLAIGTEAASATSFVAQHKRKTGIPRKYLKPATSQRSEIHSQSSISEGQGENLEIQPAVESGESTQRSSIQPIHTAVRRRKGQPKKYTPAVDQGHNEISHAMRLGGLSEDLEIHPAAIEPSVINREATQRLPPNRANVRPAQPLRRSTRIRNRPNKRPQLKTAPVMHATKKRCKSPNNLLVARPSPICVCTYCGETFSSLLYLQQHVGLHLAALPYHCEVCRKPFLQLHSFREHLQTHSGNQPYTCPYCVCGFSQPFDMLQHVRFHHSHRNLPYPGACRVSAVSPTATDSTETEGITENVDLREQAQTSQMQGKAENHKKALTLNPPSLQLHRNPKSDETTCEVMILEASSLQMQRNTEGHKNAAKPVTLNSLEASQMQGCTDSHETLNSLEASQMQGCTDSHENRAEVVTQIDWSTVQFHNLLDASSNLNSQMVEISAPLSMLIVNKEPVGLVIRNQDAYEETSPVHAQQLSQILDEHNYAQTSSSAGDEEREAYYTCEWCGERYAGYHIHFQEYRQHRS